jgi:HK97 gp10 family phage protein
MKFSADITGLAEINANIASMTKAQNKRALTAAAVEVLKAEFVPTAQALAPDDPATGGNDLKASIIAGPASKLNNRQKSLNRKRTGKAFGEGFAGTADPAGVPQEFGTVNHGPQPFMRPALQQKTQAIFDHVGKALWSIVDKSVKRAAARAAKKAGK